MNLLSHTKLLEQGLEIYLNNTIINIFDPITCESFLTGIYNKPFWEIELKLTEMRKCKHKNIKALLTTTTKTKSHT